MIWSSRGGTGQQCRSGVVQSPNISTFRTNALIGRVLSETLPNGSAPAVTSRVLMSDPAPDGLATIVNKQMVGDTRYYDAAGFPNRTGGLPLAFRPLGLCCWRGPGLLQQREGRQNAHF